MPRKLVGTERALTERYDRGAPFGNTEISEVLGWTRHKRQG
jgi:hypothetical protein